MNNFVDVSSYCQHLKSLIDQLSNVDAPVSNDWLVLQLIVGLSDAYDNVGTQIHLDNTLPLFYKAHSMLVREEIARSKWSCLPSTQSALFISFSDPSGNSGSQSSHHGVDRSGNNNLNFGGGGHSGKGSTSTCWIYTQVDLSIQSSKTRIWVVYIHGSLISSTAMDSASTLSFLLHGWASPFLSPLCKSPSPVHLASIQLLLGLGRLRLHILPVCWAKNRVKNHHHLATYLLNSLPSCTKNYLTLTHFLYHKILIYHHLRIFSCLCFLLILSASHNKLQARSTPCVFLGFPPNHKSYKCLDLPTNKIFIFHHVLFDEYKFLFFLYFFF